MRGRFQLAVGLTLTLASAAFAKCGVELWDRKTGTDPDAPAIDGTSAKVTSIGFLTALPVPQPFPSARRASPAETTVWQIKATLKEAKVEADEDYHLVMVEDSGKTMIVEIPSPHCVGANSPFAEGVKASRAAFDAEVPLDQLVASQTIGHGQMVPINVPVVVSGVGFYDRLHGQTGVAPNGIELHPVLSIQFLEHPHLRLPPPGSAASMTRAAKDEDEDEEKGEVPTLGGKATELRRRIAIPADSRSAKLTFRMQIEKPAPGAQLIIQARDLEDEVLGVIATVPAESEGRIERSLDLSAYRGATIDVVFVCAGGSRVAVDDVQLRR